MITLDLSILNQKGTPMFNSDLFANRPAAGIVGRIFISTDTLAIFRDTGSTWDAIGGGGGGTIAGSIATGQVAFGTAANTIGGTNNLFYDSSNQRLGIGTNTPSTIIDIRSAGIAVASIRGGSAANQGASYYVQNSLGNTLAAFGDESSISSGTPDLAAMIFAGTSVPLKFFTGGSVKMTLFSTGNLCINTTTDAGFKLDVNGTTRVQGNFFTNLSTGSITFIGSSGFLTQNNTQFFWDATNNRLGIGTNAPSRTLDVRGNARIETNATTELDLIAGGGNILRLTCAATTPFIGTLTSASFSIFTAATERVRIFATGNVNIGGITDGGQRLQVTGTGQFNDTRTYSTGAAISFAIVKNLTINSAISGSTGIINNANTGTNIIGASLSVPSSTTFANLFAYNQYQFSSAGLTLTATQPGTTGVRTIAQITTQNVFDGVNSGTITHVAGVQINGFYNNNTGTSTPVITNAYQLLINDTGEFAHTFSFTNRWAIYQPGINDRNYLAGNLLLNSTTDTGQILQVNGAIRVNGQASGTAGGASGNHLIINVDGTQYKIALLNP